MMIKVRTRGHDYLDGRELVILIERDDGTLSKVMPFTVEQIDPGAVIGNPTIGAFGPIKANDVLQAMMDHGWEIGLRPKGFASTIEQVYVLREHLADMRALVFRGEVKPPGAA